MTSPNEGDVWRYPYLWARETKRGETEGRKNRPAVIAVTLTPEDGDATVFLLAITTKAPTKGETAVPVPETERRRSGLASDIPLWIILDECNVDIVGRSYYLTPDGRQGAVSPRFLRQIKATLLDRLKARRVNVVARR